MTTTEINTVLVALRAAERILEDELAAGTPNKVNHTTPVTGHQMTMLHKVQAAVCAHFHTDLHTILARDQHADISWPRHVLVWAIDAYTGIGRHCIGRLIRRDHGTVYHSVGVVQGAIATADVKRMPDVKAVQELLGCKGSLAVAQAEIETSTHARNAILQQSYAQPAL